MENTGTQEPGFGHVMDAGATHSTEGNGASVPLSARRRMVSLLLYQREQGKEFPGDSCVLPTPGERIRLIA